MRFIASREPLYEALQFINGVVEKRQTLPILSNVLLNAKAGKLEFTATDLEIELTYSFSNDSIGEPGVITIPARKFLDVVKVQNEDSAVEIVLDNTQVSITCENNHYRLATLTAKEFPIFQCGAVIHEFKIQQKDLKYLIEQVYFAIALQDVRYYLNGLCFEVSPQIYRAIGSDGHRLSLSTLPNSREGNFDCYRCIIPRKTVIELLRLLKQSEDFVTVTMGENFIRINGDHYTLISKLIESKLPKYESVIPKSGDKVIIVDRDEFKQILMRSAVLTSEKHRSVQLSLRANQLIVQSKNMEQEVAKVEYNIDYQGEDLDIAFNVSYLFDVFSALQVQQARMTFSNSDSGVIIEGIGDSNCIYVIMPMRL